MAVPKRKVSKARRDKRRAHHSLQLVNLVEDPTTGELKRPHHVAPNGFYKGKQVTTAKVNQ